MPADWGPSEADDGCGLCVDRPRGPGLCARIGCPGQQVSAGDTPFVAIRLAVAGLRLRPRDLARIGQMVLQHGQWHGRQIVPADWIAESTRPRVDTGLGLQYGYQWWLGRVDVAGAQQLWIGGIGRGGQRLWIVPGLDMVVGDCNQRAIWQQADALFRQVMATVRPVD